MRRYDCRVFPEHAAKSRFSQAGRKILFLLPSVFLYIWCVSCSHPESGDRGALTVVSWVVRDGIVPLENQEMRSRVIVGFRARLGTAPAETLSVSGELYRGGSLLSRASLLRLDGPGGSLEFDLPPSFARPLSREEPYAIPDGAYTVRLRLTDKGGRTLAESAGTVARDSLCRTFRGPGVRCPPWGCRAAPERTARNLRTWTPTSADWERGYAVFQTSPLERVFPDTLPSGAAPLETIVAALSLDEKKPITVSIRSLRDLGRVTLAVSPFRRASGGTGTVTAQVASVGLLTERTGDDESGVPSECRAAPRILEPEFPVVGKDTTRAFWLTLSAAADALPGEYRAVVTISPERGRQVAIPLHASVLPVTLGEADIRYGMMMDYAFYELDSPGWTKQERRMLARRGEEIYRDLREHGMTVAYPHSRFIFATDRNGEPVTDSLTHALRSYRELGFPGPFCWYLGHLLNTAKPQHPGSILLYDEGVAERRLRDLLQRFGRLAREAGVPRDKLLVQVVDEPDAKDRIRTATAKRLHAVVRGLGFRTLITRPWPEVSVMCTGTPQSDGEAARLRAVGNEWWIYPNEALTGRNLCYTRYVFGFGAWRWGVKGVVPWTYQMSQGSNGNPFTAQDGPEIMVAYPGAHGPLPTPLWEAIRDGITDYRYIRMLERLIPPAKRRGDPRAWGIERNLAEMKRAAPPLSEEGRFGDWPPESFEGRRKDLVAWVHALAVPH
ncbi:MAG: DUF4091 domain-containing protein [Geobacteraceae bacterium]|nr:DUF4091 domain-containing protein [Geobacteraceae bacterium]